MSHLIWIYIVCPLVLNSQYDIAWTKCFFWKVVTENFVVCFLAVKELKDMGLSNCGILSKKNGDYFFLINLTILRREAKKKEERKKISLPVTLALKAPITTAADDIHKYFIIVWQRIHMKNQALFSLKDKSNKIKCRLLQLLFGARQTKLVMAYGLRDADYFRMQWFTIGDWRWLPIYLFQLSVQSLKYRLYKGKSSIHVPNGRTHGVPYRGYGYVPLRFGGGGGGGGQGERR